METTLRTRRGPFLRRPATLCCGSSEKWSPSSTQFPTEQKILNKKLPAPRRNCRYVLRILSGITHGASKSKKGVTRWVWKCENTFQKLDILSLPHHSDGIKFSVRECPRCDVSPLLWGARWGGWGESIVGEPRGRIYKNCGWSGCFSRGDYYGPVM